MPLLDHFHPPLHPRRHWDAFHSRWANALSDALNERLLPKEYFAEPQTHLGARVEIDVATPEHEGAIAVPRQAGAATATLAVPVWTPPAPPLTMPAVFPETFEVRVFGTGDNGLALVAAIELVSPGNKDWPEERRAFAIKAASYLCQEVGLILVDIVTERQANLHNETIALLGAPERFCFPKEASLYAAAYRPVWRDQEEEICIWREKLAVGGTLPVLPQAINPEVILPVDFEATYSELCRRRKLL
jgi:hypothetical protein